ncbi:DUF1294 domain-containing protein [Noviluteimonas gilva]|nr:cold shock and DUF1294 domain-containing protein [Lysobacter gilvus]
MRFAGRLTEWHDEKGYGFVVPNGGGERVFVHVKKFERLRRRPIEGELLSYEVARDDKGRLAAMRVRMAGQTAATEQKHGARRIPHTLLGLVAITAIAFAAWRGWLPKPAVIVYGFMSVVTFVLYWRDKGAAQENARRTPESELHFVSLVGGWPGALLAQGLLRHKSKKASFQATFWLTVIANVGLMTWWLSSRG